MKNVTIQINPSMVIDTILSNMNAEGKMEIIIQSIDVTIIDLLNKAVINRFIQPNPIGQCHISFHITNFPSIKEIIYNANTKRIEFLVLRDSGIKCNWENIIPIVKMTILTELMNYWKN